MWTLQLPAANDVTAFDDSSCRLDPTHPRTIRLNAGRNAVLLAMQDYRVKAQGSALHLLAPHSQVAGATVTKSDMEYLYTGGMLKVGAGRHIYDAIMGLAPNSRCPYCGHRRVRQLDHFLPQSKYPSFTVSPLNLVPSCSDCNKDKLDGDANQLTDLPLHPYFDDIDNTCWLKAQVLPEPGSVFLFYVDPNCGLPPVDMQRLQSQFRKLALDELYTTEANDELASIRLTLRQQYAIDGAVSVQEYLYGEFQSAQAHRLNAWKTAFYFAGSQNNWFCDGGFDDPELPDV